MATQKKKPIFANEQSLPSRQRPEMSTQEIYIQQAMRNLLVYIVGLSSIFLLLFLYNYLT